MLDATFAQNGTSGFDFQPGHAKKKKEEIVVEAVFLEFGYKWYIVSLPDVRQTIEVVLKLKSYNLASTIK